MSASYPIAACKKYDCHFDKWHATPRLEHGDKEAGFAYSAGVVETAELELV